MTKFIGKLARFSAIMGGIVLTLLAIMMTVSITGGGIAKFANSEFLTQNAPGFASWLQGTGIRTIPGMYEIMEMGIAFTIFSFLPIATFNRAHAVVDILTDRFGERTNEFLKAFWETVFFIVFAIITWRLFYGFERQLTTNTIYMELKIPIWWGYGIAFLQMILVSVVSFVVALAEWVRLFGGPDWLPKEEGAVH